jgi:hypothetical protein
LTSSTSGVYRKFVPIKWFDGTWVILELEWGDIFLTNFETLEEAQLVAMAYTLKQEPPECD